MTLDSCILCKEYLFYGRLAHHCPPSWLVWQEGDEVTDDHRKIYAHTEEQAIEKALRPILNDEFDDDVRTFCVLSGDTNYFFDKEELVTTQLTLADGDYYHDDEDEETERLFYEDKVKKLTESIASEAANIKKFEVTAYMTYELSFQKVK